MPCPIPHSSWVQSYQMLWDCPRAAHTEQVPACPSAHSGRFDCIRCIRTITSCPHWAGAHFVQMPTVSGLIEMYGNLCIFLFFGGWFILRQLLQSEKELSSNLAISGIKTQPHTFGISPQSISRIENCNTNALQNETFECFLSNNSPWRNYSGIFLFLIRRPPPRQVKQPKY